MGDPYHIDVENLTLDELGRALAKTQQQIERLEYERSALLEESIERLEAEDEDEAAEALREIEPPDLANGGAAIQLLGAALRGEDE